MSHNLSSDFVLLPLVALCIIVGANNLSACLGTSIGVRALRYKHAFILASVGVVGGVILEGHKLSGAITAGIVNSSNPTFILALSISSLFTMAILTHRNLPISLSQVALGAAVGSAMGLGIRIDWKFTLLIASSWLLTPLLGFAIAVLLSILARRVTKRIRGLFTSNILYAYLTIMSGVYSAYVLGANTVGLIVGLSGEPQVQHFAIGVLLAFATVVGMILLSKGTTRSVAENIVGLSPSASFAAQMGGAITVHGFTQFGIPVSVSQAAVGGVFGAAIPRKIVVQNARLTREIFLGWTFAPLMGGVLGYILSLII